MKKVPFGEFHPEDPVINAVIEAPAGSRHKFSYSVEHDAQFLTQVLQDELKFPFNYGYVPKTISGDGGPLDVFVISTHPLPSHSVVPSRVIGLIEVQDRGKRDNKVIAIPTSDKKFHEIESWDDVPVDLRGKFIDFYEHYVKQLDHELLVKGYFGKKKAVEELRLSQILD